MFFVNYAQVAGEIFLFDRFLFFRRYVSHKMSIERQQTGALAILIDFTDLILQTILRLYYDNIIRRYKICRK